MKNSKQIIITLVIFVMMASCKKENDIFLQNEVQSAPTKGMLLPNLTVNCLTNRTLSPGSTFKHEVLLTNGTKPIANATVFIVDPVGLKCASVKTNSLGKAVYSSTTFSSTPRKSYTIEFMYGSTTRFSTVAVSPLSSFTNLSTYKIDFNSASSLGSSTLVGSSRGGYQYVSQSQSTTLQKALSLGTDIVKDYTKNPGNLVISAVAVLSCSVGQFVLAAGQAACATSVQMVATGVAASTAKVFAKAAIDANSSWSTSTKKSLKAIVDLSTTAISFAKLAPGEGVKSLGVLPAAYDVLTTNFGQLIYDTKGILRGSNVAVPIKGCNDVIMMCCYKR